jgi:hypothetical protein
MHLKYIAALLLCFSLCLAIGCSEKESISTPTVSSAKTEITEKTETSTVTDNTEPVDTTSAEPTTDGIIESETGSIADYTGLYELTDSEGEFPFNQVEISENDKEDMYLYLYNNDVFVTDGYLDYSEQRALNGNALMKTTANIDGLDIEIEIFPFFVDSTSELVIELNGISGTFEKIDGTMLLFDENEASDYLLDFLGANGYSLDGTAVFSRVGDEDLGFDAWFFAWGKNDPEKFTAEKHLAVNSLRQVWEYDVLSDEWNICTIS